MSKRLAILNLADTGPCDSLQHMLEHAGYECRLASRELRDELRRIGCIGVLDVADLERDWGYQHPRCGVLADVRDVPGCDLFVDCKAHANYSLLVDRCPELVGRVLWYCLNGGDPLKRKDGLPWADPPCPVVTANQWYKGLEKCHHCLGRERGSARQDDIQHPCRLCRGTGIGIAYTCFPPFLGWNDVRRSGPEYGPPLCLVHNVGGWGHGEHVEALRRLGVKFCGGGTGNDLLLTHAQARALLAQALCLVHLKIGDTCGYSVIEAMASSVPVLVTQRYIDETRLDKLLEHGHTCWVFDPQKPRELASQFEALRDEKANEWAGSHGHRRYEQMMWNTERDGASFIEFMRRNFQ